MTVTGSHSKNGAQSVIASEIRDESLNCDSGTGSECWPFMLVYINSIDYDYYTFLVSLPKEDNPGRSVINLCRFLDNSHAYIAFTPYRQLEIRALSS